MKTNSLFRLIALPVFTAGVLFCQSALAHEHDDKEDTPLAKTMKNAGKALKSLRKLPKDDWAGGVKAARTAAEGIRLGMEHIPALIKEMQDGAEKDKAIADYRRLMGLNYAALCELELAYLEKDAVKVEAATKSWKALKKEGHKKYEDE